MVSRSIIERYGNPSLLDQAQYGTICKVSSHHRDTYDIYLQVGDDEEDPEWEHLGSFDEKSKEDYINQLIDSRLNKNVHYG